MHSYYILFRRIIIVIFTVLLFSPLSSAVKVSAASPAPMLVIVDGSNSSNPYGNYLGEILRAEGLNAFVIQDLSLITLSELQNHSLAILAETTLTSNQAKMFTDYVNGGGRLLAMRPDAQIAGLFSLGSKAGTATERYVKFLNSASWNAEAPASGLPSSALQTHGTADRYNLATGAVMIAELYASRTSSDGYPAVVGSANGRAAAFTYDLAKSVAYTRQGNPANANVDVDGDTFIKMIDLFQTAGGGSWVDLELMNIPQADEQQRLFARLVRLMVSAAGPLPQLWYFPNGKKTMLIITADAHGNTLQMFQQEIDSLNLYNAKATFYLSIAGNPLDSDVVTWTSQGHTFGLHPYGYLNDPSYPVNNLTQGYNAWETWFSQQFYSTPKSNTVRNHMIVWEGWTTAAEIAISHNISIS